MDTTENKYQVYTQGGILVESVDYAMITHLYGPPVSVSSNGQLFIFKKPKSMTL